VFLLVFCSFFFKLSLFCTLFSLRFCFFALFSLLALYCTCALFLCNFAF
jgi:hypothetical protein